MLQKLKGFDYYAPSSLEDGASLLNQFSDSSKILAGGTDLLVQIKYGQRKPQHLIGIKKIPGLSGISYEKGKGLRMGALATIREVETSTEVKQRFPAITYAASKLGSVQVRNLATIGGNLCHASPSAEMAPSLIGFGTIAHIFSNGAIRTIPLENFFLGPGQTVLKPNEILIELVIPDPPPHATGCYIRHSVRRAMDIAIVNVAVVICQDSGDGACRDARIVLGAVAPTPIRAKRAEAVLTGRVIDEALIKEAAQVASEESKPISDVRSSAEYRKEMVKVMVSRAAKEALGMGKYTW